MLHSDGHSESTPIWLAALLAAGCEATANGRTRRIEWRCASGRAVYTNSAAESEIVQPFGVAVRRGESVVVTWRPGETGYTVELARAAA